MATSYDEGLYISDIVKAEADMQRSRESMLVDASQTLVRGQVVQKGIGDRIKSIGVLVNEVQTSAEAGASAGVFRLGIPQQDGSVDYTTQLAFGATSATINTAIDATGLAAASIVAVGTDIGSMVFTFSGVDVAGKTWPLITIQGDAAFNATTHGMTRTTMGGHATAQTNEVQTNTHTTDGTAGTFNLSFPHWNGTTLTTTAGIAWDANAATIKTAIEVVTAAASPVVQLGEIDVTGTNINSDDIVFTFRGEHYEGRDWPMVTFADLPTTMTAASFAETTKGSGSGEGGGEGSGDAIGIVLNAVTTAGGVLTTKETVLVRDAVVDVDQVTFGVNANKVDVIAQLKKVGIIMRSEPETTSA